MTFPEELFYTHDHECLRKEDGHAYVGITDFAQKELGDIVYVEIETLGKHLKCHEVFGTVEAVKTVSDLYLPVSGEVMEINPKIASNPELVNSDPYGDGWLIKIKVDLNELIKFVIIKCDDKGNIDINDLKLKAEEHKTNLSCLMVTYPSTHGVYEEGIKYITQIIHDNGGQVYMDGANMNAQVGLTSPGNIGADVCHLNLHKTFAIPHGGGGPGVGPIGVAEHLVPYLPSHSQIKGSGEKSITALSAAPYGSALILLISYGYIKMLGGTGLTHATRIAILNANYIKAKLTNYYPTLYSGKNGFCAHEMILDCHTFKKETNVEVGDIAKRLMDYGFHAPTVSFPVHDTLMVEPTESESKAELDRFCEAMIGIKKEIDEIAGGKYDKADNVLKNAPHTSKSLLVDSWSKDYSRTKAAFPLKWLENSKFWPSVGKIDNAFGDRNLICSCPEVKEYLSTPVEELQSTV